MRYWCDIKQNGYWVFLCFIDAPNRESAVVKAKAVISKCGTQIQGSDFRVY